MFRSGFSLTFYVYRLWTLSFFTIVFSSSGFVGADGGKYVKSSLKARNVIRRNMYAKAAPAHARTVARRSKGLQP